jgi:hypothetical protein
LLKTVDKRPYYDFLDHYAVAHWVKDHRFEDLCFIDRWVCQPLSCWS